MEPRSSKPALLGAALLGLSVMCACTRSNSDSVVDTMAERREADAVARLSGHGEQGAQGFVRFVKEEGGVRVIAQLAGLPPGQHGFHIHENGDCTGPDFTSAGPHFAGKPTPDAPHLGEAHGFPEAEARHAGDLGNVTADGGGTARMDRLDDVIALDGEQSIVGRAIIVHAAGDDGKSVDSAGARIACGVIERAAPLDRAHEGRATPGPDVEPGREPLPHGIPPLTPPPPAVP